MMPDGYKPDGSKIDYSQLDDYQHNCLQTEAPIDEGVMQRANECAFAISEMLNFFKEDSKTTRGLAGLKMADIIKKYIFYGKQDVKLDNLLKIYSKSSKSFSIPKWTEVRLRILHSLLGIISEAQEFSKQYHNVVFSENEIFDFDYVNIMEELGDTGWYLAIGADAIDENLSEILEKNTKKLMHRYPERFDAELAVNRDLKGERKILEDDKK